MVLSLALNLALFRLVSLEGVVGAVRSREARQDVALAPLSREAWEANRRIAPPPGREPSPVAPLASAPVASSPPPAPPPPPPPPPRKVEGQVVDVAPSRDRTPPKESRFVSEEDNTVAKETRSRHRAPGYENTLPVPGQPSPDSRPAAPEPQGQEVAGQQGAQGTPRIPSPAPAVTTRPPRPAPAAKVARPRSDPSEKRAPDASTGEKLALLQEPRGELGLGKPAERSPGQERESAGASEGNERERARAALDPAGPLGLPGAPGGAKGPASLQLRPSAAAYARLAGGPSPDKLDGVEEGEGTFLNTRGWKYASYFNRIKRALANEWDPSTAMRARDPSGARFGQRDWMTVLSVKLDDQGALKDLSVERSSGLDFLDVTALQAFRKAQPFANPPRGLADERGEIAFTFSFTFEVSRGLSGLFGRPPPE